MTEFPDDADGQALQRLVHNGCDLSLPMDIDFQIAAPDEDTAIQIANAAAGLGYRTEVFFDEDIEDVDEASEPWTCECSRVMVVSYQSIRQTQAELDGLAKPHSCYVDGWSTFGNAD